MTDGLHSAADKDWVIHADNLVNGLRATANVKSDIVANALLRVPRHDFLHSIFVRQNGVWTKRHLDYNKYADLELVYQNEAFVVRVKDHLPDVTQTSPDIVATMLELLELHENPTNIRVLEIGTGTGYVSALLGIALGPGAITSLEKNASLARVARQNLRAVGQGALKVVHTDGLNGYAASAPYQRILVNGAVDSLPKSWPDQLAEGGVLVVIRGGMNSQQLLQLRKTRGSLSGIALRHTHFPFLEDGLGHSQPALRFLSSVRFTLPGDDAPIAPSTDAFECFENLDESDFLFFLELEEPRLTLIPGLSDPDSTYISIPRPAILDQDTGEFLLGPPEGHDTEPVSPLYGPPELLSRLVRVHAKWKKLDKPALSSYSFYARPDVHNRDALMNQAAWHIKGNVTGSLDWRIEVT